MFAISRISPLDYEESFLEVFSFDHPQNLMDKI